MNPKLTGVLVLVAIIVGGVAYFNPFAGDDDDGPKSPWFYQVSEDDIATIYVSHLGDSVSFRKTEADTWAFNDPEGVPPDFRRWGGITLLLSGPQTKRDLTVARPTIDDPAQYGLDSPDTIVIVGLTAGRTLEFRLGDPTPDGGHHYAQVIGFDQLFTIANVWGEVISRLATEHPLPKWYIKRDVNSIVELNVFQGDPTQEIPPSVSLKYNRNEDKWTVFKFGEDDVARAIDPERWEQIRPLIAGPPDIHVVVPKVDDRDYSRWGIDDDSPSIEIRFSGTSPRGSRFTDGILLRLGDKTEDGTGYYSKSESSIISQPILFLDATWTETILGLYDDPPYDPNEEDSQG